MADRSNGLPRPSPGTAGVKNPAKLPYKTAGWPNAPGEKGSGWGKALAGFREVKMGAVQDMANDGKMTGIGGMVGNVIGSVIGSYFGGPVGGQVGGMIGKAEGTNIGEVADKKRPLRDAFLPPDFRKGGFFQTGQGMPGVATPMPEEQKPPEDFEVIK